MIFTEQDRANIQAALDAQYEQAQKDYAALVAANSPYLLYVAKPERLIFQGTLSQFTKARNNIRAHYGHKANKR